MQSAAYGAAIQPLYTARAQASLRIKGTSACRLDSWGIEKTRRYAAAHCIHEIEKGLMCKGSRGAPIVGARNLPHFRRSIGAADQTRRISAPSHAIGKCIAEVEVGGGSRRLRYVGISDTA